VARRPVASIAVLRALPGVGDLLCLVPSLRAIRARHPRAVTTLLGLPTARWFVERYGQLVDDLLPVEGVPGLPEVAPDPAVALRFLRRAQERRFDLALQLHGSGVTTNVLLTLVGARHQVTARRPGDWTPPGVSVVYPGAGPEVHRLLAVTAAAGCPAAGGEASLPLTPAERAEAMALVTNVVRGGRALACLHPGASRVDNRWPVERFAAVGDALVRRGHDVVITGSTTEQPVTDAVAAAMREPAAGLAGRTSIGVLGALFALARVVVTNDTGASHVAAAVRSASVVVFPSDGDPDRWAPLDAILHLRLRPVGTERWPSVADVLQAVDQHLGRQTSAAAWWREVS
jgi:ADP-heptose:LPS heptosyltransferase